MTGTWGTWSSAQVGSLVVGWHSWVEPGPGPIEVSWLPAGELTNVFCGLNKNGAPFSSCSGGLFWMTAWAVGGVLWAALVRVGVIVPPAPPAGTSACPTARPASGPDATVSFTVTVWLVEIGSSVVPSAAVN